MYENLFLSLVLGCFVGFSTQSHAESCGNHAKKSFLDPKRDIVAKISEFVPHQTSSRRQVLTAVSGSLLLSQEQSFYIQDEFKIS